MGFSVALGAFLAGLSISGSEDLHEAHTALIPLRDAFVALFFVSLGTLVVPSVIIHNLPLLGVMLLLIVVGKFVVWLGVMKLFRYSLWTSIAVAAGLTQIGELSFILVEVAKKSGLVGEEDLHRHPSRIPNLNFPEYAASKVGDAQNHAKTRAEGHHRNSRRSPRVSRERVAE